jgi:hypothetical protein
VLLSNGAKKGVKGNIFGQQLSSIARKALQQAGPTPNLRVKIEE